MGKRIEPCGSIQVFCTLGFFISSIMVYQSMLLLRSIIYKSLIGHFLLGARPVQGFIDLLATQNCAL